MLMKTTIGLLIVAVLFVHQNAACVDICKLPLDLGRGRGYFPSWFYNSTAGECEPFIFGGGLGNANRFRRLEECQNRCP
ncbi:kappaPI-actitoxin-Avd3b [Drosophila sulfurigaster albostrigata]|uniref:kappaPI-actitoxin-Avd3b n=1 Tax=Drosophila sulfurigaster albostrigata TaxID=89887 RepID=UPI002D21B086|nr:kappaPI-actitoxin-Avd3b [Drosophila sulfurigaster albostrigata]